MNPSLGLVAVWMVPFDSPFWVGLAALVVALSAAGWWIGSVVGIVSGLVMCYVYKTDICVWVILPKRDKWELRWYIDDEFEISGRYQSPMSAASAPPRPSLSLGR